MGKLEKNSSIHNQFCEAAVKAVIILAKKFFAIVGWAMGAKGQLYRVMGDKKGEKLPLFWIYRTGKYRYTEKQTENIDSLF